jgi:hypothetical protein
VAVEEADGWVVVGRVEPVERGWLALTADDRRISGPNGPVWPTREAAAEVVARVLVSYD